MTRAELRAVLHEFRAMVRARGPEELLEVANLQWYRPGEFENSAAEWLHHHGAARAALRWWRWANRQSRWLGVYVPNDDYYVHSIQVWPPYR